MSTLVPSHAAETYSDANSFTSSHTISEKPGLHLIDIIIVSVYIVGTLIFGIWVSLRGTRGTVQKYFLAGRSMFWLPIGASIFVSNVGAGNIIGLAGTGAAAGIAVTSFEWIPIFIILQLGWLFIPIYLDCKVFTMPEYIYKRFGGTRLRVTLAVISLVLCILTRIAVDLYAGALFIQQAFNINLYIAIISLLVITGVYTILGGLKTVIYVNTMQSVVMLSGGLMLMIMGFIKIGGYSNLEPLYMKAIPQKTMDILASGNTTTCGMPQADSFHIFRDPVTSNHPWPGMLMGIYFGSTYYWCTDQVIVQRALAAKSLNHAKGGCVLAGFLKILPMYMTVMMGMISRILFPNEVACADQVECEKICGNSQGCSNIAYPKLVLGILPAGLQGIMIAAMLSAFMSALTSTFNSTSTVFTMDVWKSFRKTASERELLFVGIGTVAVLVLISIAWVPVVLSSAGGELYIYVNMIHAPVGPALAALFLFAILWPRVNEQGAFWGLISGIFVAIIRLIFEFTFKTPFCDQDDTRPWLLRSINYLYFSPIVFAVSSFVTLAVSYSTKPLSHDHLVNTTWFTRGRSSIHRTADEETKQKILGSTGNNIEKISNDGQMELENLNPTQDLYADGDNLSNTSEGRKDYGSNPDADIDVYLDKSSDNGSKFKWGFLVNVFAMILCVTVAFLLGFYA